MFERETPFLLVRTDESDEQKISGAGWMPRFKLVRKGPLQLNFFGLATRKLVNYIEIVYSDVGRLEDSLAACLPNNKWNVVVIVAEYPRKKRKPGFRIRTVGPTYQTFEKSGIHISEVLSNREGWKIRAAMCETLEALFDRYRPP